MRNPLSDHQFGRAKHPAVTDSNGPRRRPSARQGGRARLKPLYGIAALCVAVWVAVPTAASAAPSATIDFTDPGYTTAPTSPSGQNGWVLGRGDSDISLVDNDTFPAAGLPAGGRSLQISYTTTPAGGADLVAPNIDPAGEPQTGAAANTFEVSFTVASATGGIQPGLDVDVAIDGASRYGGVLNLRHTAAGLEIGSYWLPADATGTDNAQWRSAVYTTVPADQPHVIRMVDVFLEGQPDSVSVYVDGALVSNGSGVTTWEFYNRLAATGGDQVANTISFKRSSSAPTADGIGYQAGLPTAPGTAGLGYLFTGISYAVSTSAPPLPTAPPALPAQADPSPDTALTLDTGTVPATGGALAFQADGFLPYENVFATLFPARQFGGWFQADADGHVSGTIQVPAGLDAGTATLQLTGSASQFTASNTFTVAAAASTPSPTPTPDPDQTSPAGAVSATPPTPDPDQTSPAGAVSATSTATPPTELAVSGTNSTGYLVGAALALVLGAVILITRSHARRTS